MNGKMTILDVENITRVPRHRVNDWVRKGMIGLVEEVTMGRRMYRVYTPKQAELIRLINEYRDDHSLSDAFALAKDDMRGE